MRTDSDLLILAQWFSPSYPLGSFAYSHGLETAIAAGRIDDADSLLAWLQDVLAHGTGLNDCILIRAAHACDDAAAAIGVDARARAFASSAERLAETLVQGGAFARTTAAIWGGTLPELTHPVAVGYAAGRMSLPLELTAQMYLQAFAGNLVSAAVRLVPLGQTEGQACLAALGPLVAQVVEKSRDMDLDDLASSAFLSDVAAMRHETLEHRIFRS
ncbi:urease accessory protein UreF [Sulfitobacter alexandrii]|uniref:Urease accessory protein UreF n=1 Tax=Sulfitobacter alexandrii TaxID=1917485 RepID=A0A1J0WHT3_9RHOB|nr:urease accessory UreF family protein [Sulfitobacter alexandrii]APE43694.1 urease accessory protein UreF [Sulfitobacter alexandrii]